MTKGVIYIVPKSGEEDLLLANKICKKCYALKNKILPSIFKYEVVYCDSENGECDVVYISFAIEDEKVKKLKKYISRRFNIHKDIGIVIFNHKPE